MHGTRVWESVERRQLRRRGPRMERRQPGQRPDEAQPAGTDLLPQIKHIVVLMMENHSFDNYLGTLRPRRGPARRVPTASPTPRTPTPAASPVRAHHLPCTGSSDGVPCQSWSATHAQWADGKMHRVRDGHRGLPAPRGRDQAAARHGLLDRAGPALLLRPGPHVPAGRPLVQLLPGADVPQPPLPASPARRTG